MLVVQDVVSELNGPPNVFFPAEQWRICFSIANLGTPLQKAKYLMPAYPVGIPSVESNDLGQASLGNVGSSHRTCRKMTKLSSDRFISSIQRVTSNGVSFVMDKNNRSTNRISVQIHAVLSSTFHHVVDKQSEVTCPMSRSNRLLTSGCGFATIIVFAYLY